MFSQNASVNASTIEQNQNESEGSTSIANNAFIPDNPTSNPIILEIDPEFTFEGAYELGDISSGVTVTENVGGSDDGDAYQFTITQAGEYSFFLDGKMQEYGQKF